MLRDGAATRLRVGLLGTNPDADEWATLLAGRAFEVVRGADLPALLRSAPSVVVVVAEPQDAPGIVAQISARADTPPVTLFLGRPGVRHPYAALFRSLMQGKADWEGTFDAIVDPIVLLDRSGAVSRANLGLAGALGLPIRGIVGRHYADLFGAPAPDSSDPIAESLADGLARTREARFERLAGIQQVTTSPLNEPDGGLRGLAVIVKNVVDLKEQQERMMQASRLAEIGQLAAGVAHEINTPLASIALRTESLRKTALDAQLQACEAFKNFPRYLKTIEEETFRCKRIIGSLLEFSRSRKPEVREIDLNLLAERAGELVGHQMKLKQVSLSLRLAPEGPRIWADDGQISQALIALLMNALDATRPGGNVTVETETRPSGAIGLAVADDGVGIRKEHLDKIFNPFFTTKPVGQGTGLGLAICHGIVASHGGEIEVESEPERGTRIVLLLPKGAPPTGSGVVTRAAAAAEAGRPGP